MLATRYYLLCIFFMRFDKSSRIYPRELQRCFFVSPSSWLPFCHRRQPSDLSTNKCHIIAELFILLLMLHCTPMLHCIHTEYCLHRKTRGMCVSLPILHFAHRPWPSPFILATITIFNIYTHYYCISLQSVTPFALIWTLGFKWNLKH